MHAKPLKPGFIFIQLSDTEDRSEYPSGYLTTYYGGIGYLGRLTAESINGWEPIPVAEYEAA